MQELKLLICACHSPDHQAIVYSCTDDHGTDLYLEVLLIPHRFWWKRLRDGLRYICGFRSCYGHFDEFIFDRESATTLRDALTEYLRTKESPCEP